MIYVLLWILVGYVFFMFFLVRLFVPYLGFWKEPVPDRLPVSLERKIPSFRNKSKKVLVDSVYRLLSDKYYGRHLLVWVNFDLLFTRDWNKVWSHSGYLPCTQINQLFRIILVKSGFSDDDIRFRITWSGGLIHQYLQVRLGGGWKTVDIWAAGYGKKLGEHAGF